MNYDNSNFFSGDCVEGNFDCLSNRQLNVCTSNISIAKTRLIPVYKITNRGLRHWLPMATNNLIIDDQCIIIALTKFLPIMIGTNW